MQKFRLLANNPSLGKGKPELIINVRSFPYKKYIIFYFPMEGGVEIFRVLHGSRDIQSVFDEMIDSIN